MPNLRNNCSIVAAMCLYIYIYVYIYIHTLVCVCAYGVMPD